MERTTSLIKAKEIMGINFIGPDELKPIEKKLGIRIPDNIMENLPLIQFSEDLLKKSCNDYILILCIPYYKDGTPLSIVKMREYFGWDPEFTQPCFYNQDWYLKEMFANDQSMRLQWYLIRKQVHESTKGINPSEIIKSLGDYSELPTAVLCVFTFFAEFFISGQKLWEFNYVWCCDRDNNHDQIYIGHYSDINQLKKNGLEIHRHLSLKKNYGAIDLIIPDHSK
jgi:hypothetical protein